MKKYVKVINNSKTVKSRIQIIISKNGKNIYNPTEEMILADGWEEYVPPVIETHSEPRKSPLAIMQEIITEQYNSKTDISDKEALDRAIVIYDWAHYIGKPLTSGQVVVYDNKVYRVRQDISEVLGIYPPSLSTAALYEVIVLTATGEENDPIQYTPPMEIYEGKYYIQDNIKYLCTRDSGTALTHNLTDLIGLYVTVV